MPAIFPLALVFVEVGKHHCALSIHVAILPLTLILVTVSKHHYAVSVHHLLLPLTLVHVTATIHHGALPVHLALLPLTLILVIAPGPCAASICTVTADTLANHNTAARKAKQTDHRPTGEWRLTVHRWFYHIDLPGIVSTARTFYQG